jgi:hypothetical protein
MTPKDFILLMILVSKVFVFSSIWYSSPTFRDVTSIHSIVDTRLEEANAARCPSVSRGRAKDESAEAT